MYVKCMEMFLFGGFPCGAFDLQTDKIMNTFIISITTEYVCTILLHYDTMHMVAIFYPSCYNIPNSVGPIQKKSPYNIGMYMYNTK